MAEAKETRRLVSITDPPFARALFGDVQYHWIWLIARLWVGYQWVASGAGKLDDPKWMETGVALKGFWERAVMVPPQGRPPIVFDWYRDFIRFLLDSGSYTWFAKLVATGETLVGIALIVGAFVGVAAFLGAFMNWNFMMAGTASTNPAMFAVALVLVLAWKTAGYWGVDRWLLPALGTPWGPGRVFVNGPELAVQTQEVRTD